MNRRTFTQSLLTTVASFSLLDSLGFLGCCYQQIKSPHPSLDDQIKRILSGPSKRFPDAERMANAY